MSTATLPRRAWRHSAYLLALSASLSADATAANPPDCDFIGLTVFVPDQDEVTEGESFSVTVRRDGLPLTEKLDLKVGAATRLSGATIDDYSDIPEVVTIPAGEASVSFKVTTRDDNAHEENESARLTAWPANGPQLPVRLWDATVSEHASILDNDDQPVLTVEASDAQEGGDPGEFTIRRESSDTGPVRILYSLGLTAGTMAAPEADYELPEQAFLMPGIEPGSSLGTVVGWVELPEGENSVSIPIQARDDAVVEEDDHVRITILNKLTPFAVGPRVGTQQSAELAIIDNDAAKPDLSKVQVELKAREPKPGVKLPAASEEGTKTGEPAPISFLISRNDSKGELEVSYTLSGTAKMGTHYQSLPGKVTFAAGKKTIEVEVVPINDANGTCFIYPAPLEGETPLTEQSKRSVIIDLEASDSYQITSERARTAINDVEDRSCFIKQLCASRNPAEPGKPTSFFTEAILTRGTTEKYELLHIWDFGDGSKKCESRDTFGPQAHIYEEPGKYTVTVTALAQPTLSSPMDAFSTSQSLELEVAANGEVVDCRAATAPPPDVSTPTSPGGNSDTPGGDGGSDIGGKDGETEGDNGCSCRLAATDRAPATGGLLMLLLVLGQGWRRLRNRRADAATS